MNDELTDFKKEITILDIFNILINNLRFIIITTVFFFLSSFVYTFFIATPNYISSADVMVQVEQDTSSSDGNFDLVNAFRLIDTVAELMEKDVVLENALRRLQVLGYEDIDVKYLREGLNVTSSATSYFINISFIDENTDLARDSVDAIIDAIIEETDIADAFPVLTDKIRRTSFSSEAIYNSPNKTLFVVSGFMLGLVGSMTFALLKELLSTEFRGKSEVEEVLKIQVLGVIPKMSSKEIKNGKK